MYAYELYETPLEELGLKSAFPRSNKLTLRHLNKLNRIKKNREREQTARQALVRLMYGDQDFQHSHLEARLEQERLQHELELAKQGLEQDRLKIEHEIELAKLSDEGRAKVRDVAHKVIGRKLKS